jgi:hypothetical protein
VRIAAVKVNIVMGEDVEFVVEAVNCALNMVETMVINFFKNHLF